MVNDWLLLLCELLPQVDSAAVIRANGKGAMATWPTPNTPCEPFYPLTKKVIKEGVFQIDSSDGSFTTVAFPMRTQGVLFAVLCIKLDVPKAQIGAVQALVQWAISWLEAQGKSKHQTQSSFEQILNVLELCSRQKNILDSSALLTSTLADVFSLDRVVLTLVRNGKQEVMACSHTANVDTRVGIFNQLDFYLNEPNAEEKQASLQALKTQLNAGLTPLCFETFVLDGGDVPLGYIVAFHPVEKPLTASEKAQFRIIARQLTPLYSHWVNQHHSWLWRIKRNVATHIKSRKSAVFAAAVVVAIVSALIQVPHIVKAQASLEGSIEQAIVAPEDGFLKAAYFQAGEIIQKRQTLAQLDDNVIRLEVQRWQGEKQEYERQYSRELNALNHVQMRIAKAKIEQAQAQLNIYQQQLQRINIEAPMDGVIIRGDLSRAIGSPIKRGQVLFEMAPVDSFKLVMWVKEQDIRFVQLAQKGKLLLSAFPQTPIEFEVAAVSSLYDDQKNEIVYRVEATLNPNNTSLRPGMSGVAKILTGKRPLFWLAGHDFWAWLKLRLWVL